MSNLKTILDRLVQENLHGPVDQGNQYSIKYQAIRQAAVARKKAERLFRDNDKYPYNDYNNRHKSRRYDDPDDDLIQGQQQQQQYVEDYDGLDEDGDLDSRDPRWQQLFYEFFLSENSDDRNDDLLFFVQKLPTEAENGGLGVDPIFVKRNVKSTAGFSPQHFLTPEQEAVVLWKDTFFLNVIVQLPCKLTVSVCSRVSVTDPITGITKSSMTCTQGYVSKRVYAMPTKSRVDVKEAAVECSWPLIYYVIDDYEEMFEQLFVRDNEYLCVELAVTLPSSATSRTESGYPSSHKENSHWNSIPGDDRPHVGKPFPSTISRGGDKGGGGSDKIVLFHGAVGFSNLLGIYQNKAASKVERKFKFGPHTVPTEFIMMRGPRGHGHAQVAITASNYGNESSLSNLDSSSPTRAPNSPFKSSLSTSDNLYQQGTASPKSRNEKSLPLIPGANGHATIAHHQHHRHKQLQPPKIDTGSSTPSTSSSSTSPNQHSFSAKTIFNSLRRLSISALTQAIASPPTSSTNNENSNDAYNQNHANRSSNSLGSQPESASPITPINKRAPNSNLSNKRNNGEGGGISPSGVGSRHEIEALVNDPQSLKCCMTFVNVPWTGIATLLVDYAYNNSNFTSL
ncbi:hypothetical protein BGZ46_003692 [Entomortierella lignicola]|nr:hypothetical protein BGZ46_003692 [Entomortierella lignicola]